MGITKNNFLIGLLIVAVGAAVYFSFFFSYSCGDIPCFQTNQKECVRTTFVKDSVDSTLLFEIKGKNGNMCEIDVAVLDIKTGTVDKLALERKAMTCELPLGDGTSPEADLQNCQGPLKEELQHLIIQQMHAYILDNLGDIETGLEQII